MAAPFAEEVLQQPARFFCMDAVDDLGAVVALRVIEHPCAMPHPAHPGVLGTVIEHRDPRGRDGGGAHRAGLQRDPQPRAGQAFRPQGRAGFANRQDLGMGGRVGQRPGAVAGPRQHAAIGADQNGTDRHLAPQGGGARLIQRLGHMGREGHGGFWPA